ncbi:hypothetical protein APHAL10511_005415 [Amanita phalloides]|nr:hypothetical protein APHAL10511_005415 [Amanita phalloides]
MLRSFLTLLSVILLITANACNGLSNLRRVAYENASAISADAIPSPPGCCTGSQTYQCCGGICCAGNEICELGECISKDIVNSGRLIRFKLDWKKNGLLLRNMCNGMQGKNTATLTYSGQLSPSARAAKQRAAGCVSGYCRSLINNGTNTSDLDSCNEFPPASSNEGGDTRPANERAFSCIPGYQNCIQGATFRSVYQGTKIQAGQQFVISINCEEVFDSKVKRGLTGDSSYEPTKRSILQTRDTINMTGTTNANDTFNLATNATPYISAPFGDLEAGAQVHHPKTFCSLLITFIQIHGPSANSVGLNDQLGRHC